MYLTCSDDREPSKFKDGVQYDFFEDISSGLGVIWSDMHSLLHLDKIQDRIYSISSVGAFAAFGALENSRETWLITRVSYLESSCHALCKLINIVGLAPPIQE